MAALRAGSDLVSVIAPEPVVSAIRSYSPNLMVSSLGTQVLIPEVVESVVEAAEKNNVVQKLLELEKPMVLDADALKALAASEIKLNPDLCVLTPHWGELSILLDADSGDNTMLQNRVEQALECAKMYNSVVLLKGPVDVIAEPEGQFKLNRTGVSAMTVGGTGDVLTGIVAALLSRKQSAFRAASAAAFISGIAGEIAFDERGNHILATDCIENIHFAFDL